MADIKHPTLLYLKGGLFVLLGFIAIAIILLTYPAWQLAALLAIAIWSFCRAYYFAFYVIQHYVDQQFRFAGLWHAARHIFGRKEPTAELKNHSS